MYKKIREITAPYLIRRFRLVSYLCVSNFTFFAYCTTFLVV